MNSLDFQDLREEIVSAASVPDLDEIYRRGRRREVATHPSWLVGAAVIVVVAALIGGNLIGRQVSTTPSVADRPALGEPVHLPLQGSEIPVDGPFTVLSSVTSDQWTTYTMVKTASGSLAVATTFDGGAHWFAWTLPAQMTATAVVNFDSAGPGQFVSLIVKKAGNDVLYISMDGGQSWGPQPALGTPVDAFPAGWALDVQYRQVVARDPQNGVPHPLKNKWTSDYPYLGETRIVEAKDGSLWRTTRADGRNSDIKFEVSRDRGRTWTSRRAPILAGFDPRRAVVDSFDGKTGYAEIYYFPSGAHRDVGKLFVTHNGGDTWTHVGPDLSWEGSVLVMPDGKVLASQSLTGNSSPFGPQELQVSDDGGKSFRPLPGSPDFGRDVTFRGAMRTPTGGYVLLTTSRAPVSDNRDKYQWHLTTDGNTWTTPPLPPNSTATPWDVGPSPFR